MSIPISLLDWLNNDQTCKNDNSQPAYMSKNPGGWMYNTQKECCKERYRLVFPRCLLFDTVTYSQY